MAKIDLKALTPHKVSRDLSGYITYVYGPPKAGKTTLGSQMPKPLILAFERGYNALPGVYAQDITSWAELKQVVRQLKDTELQEQFSTIVIDTVDIAATLCDKYVCNQNDVDAIGAIPYGQGWGLLKKEFEEPFRTITQLGYAVYFISHAKERTITRKDGSEFSKMGPSVSATYNAIIENMADIYGYLHPVTENGQTKVVIDLRAPDDTISSGGRFKYIVPQIDCSYDNLVKALNDAIDKEAQLTGNQFVTDEREKVTKTIDLDFDAEIETFNSIMKNLTQTYDEDKFVKDIAPRITEVTNKYLGRGKKVKDCTREQVDMVFLINVELKDIFKLNDDKE